jgi:hypothetical protein
VVEHHRQHADRLPDRLFFQASRVKLADKLRDGLRGDRFDGAIAETRQQSAERDTVGLRGPLGHVDARRLPPVGCHG